MGWCFPASHRLINPNASARMGDFAMPSITASARRPVAASATTCAPSQEVRAAFRLSSGVFPVPAGAGFPYTVVAQGGGHEQ
jgi:hypothetical protein